MVWSGQLRGLPASHVRSCVRSDTVTTDAVVRVGLRCTTTEMLSPSLTILMSLHWFLYRIGRAAVWPLPAVPGQMPDQLSGLISDDHTFWPSEPAVDTMFNVNGAVADVKDLFCVNQ